MGWINLLEIFIPRRVEFLCTHPSKLYPGRLGLGFLGLLLGKEEKDSMQQAPLGDKYAQNKDTKVQFF